MISFSIKHLFISLALAGMILSLYPWSISGFVNRISQFPSKAQSKHPERISIFPRDIFIFTSDVEQRVPSSSPIAFITQKGNGEKDFFILSYRLFPRTIYWLSDAPVGPISWWHKNNLSQRSLENFMEKEKIEWIITNDTYDIETGIPAKEKVRVGVFSLKRWERE